MLRDLNINKIIKIFLFSFALLIISSYSFAQNYNWITPNQIYLKMYLVSDGIYRIEQNDFINSGISTSSIDPRTVKVLYKGNQVPIYFFGEQDGSFDNGDFFDFYGQRNYGGLTNTYNELNTLLYTTNEYYNLYSDTSVYWITWNGAFGSRMQNYNNTTANVYPFDYYYKTNRFEQDSIYYLGAENDFFNFTNDKYQGEGWYMKRMAFNNSLNRITQVNYPSASPQNCYLRFFAQAGAKSQTNSFEHRYIVKVNTTQFDTIKSNHFDKIDSTLIFSSSLINTGNNTLSFRYLPVENWLINFFDLIEFSYPSQFYLEDQSISFKSEISDTSVKLFKVKGFNNSNPVNIYDTKNGCKIENYFITGDELTFYGKGNGNYEISNLYITKKPFRIKQKQVPNLVSNSTGADYIIVYNKLFESQAEQLRQYRSTHNTFRSLKVEIEDIYDIFNYGMEDPVAVKRFMKNAYDNWQLPKVKFLCLFGRGSVDPKKNMQESQYYKNFVPVYGNPVCDNYFVSMNFDSRAYVPLVSVGRLPAYDISEAQNMVNNIISYESQPLDEWCKNFTFITGGYDVIQQQTNNNSSNYFIENYILPPTISGKDTKIYLDDTTGLVTYNYSDSIKNTIDRGTLIVNFIAHAGSGFWNNNFDDGNVLSNNSRMPLVLSMTCTTGRFADGTRGYGEKFMIYPNKGSSGFISTTGWSFNNTGNTFNNYLLYSFDNDKLRYTGDIIRNAAFKMSPDTGGFYSRNTINSYNLIGDPAVKLLMPDYPEFVINQNNYSVSTKSPSIREKINFKVFPHNFGTNADSCKVRFSIFKNNQNYKMSDTVLYNFGYVDTLIYRPSLDSTGYYKFKVIIDPDNWWIQESNADNQLEVIINAANYSFVPLKPVNNQMIANDSVTFVLINPNLELNKYNCSLSMLIDTTALFNSPLLRTYNYNSFSGITTTITKDIPITNPDIVYYWKVNTRLNADSLGWSPIQKFIYTSAQIPDSVIKIKKYKIGQYGNDDTKNINNDFLLNSFSGSIISNSCVVWPWNASYVYISNFGLQLDDRNRGLNLFKVSRTTSSVVEHKNFRVTSAATSDTVINFLNTFDSTFFLVVCKSDYTPGGIALTSSARNKFKEFGSTFVDSVGTFGWYSTWAFMGYTGTNPALKKEKFIYYPGGGGDPKSSNVSSNFQFIYPSGYINQIIGPAQNWNSFNWEQILYPNTNISFNVIGIKKDNTEIPLLNNITNNNFVDLQSIDALQYPNLRLITNITLDSNYGVQSPVFSGLNFNYIAPPEIALDNNSIIKSDSIVSAGDSVSIGGNYYNLGFTTLNAHIRNYYALDGAENKVYLRNDTIYQPLAVNSSMFFKASFRVSGLPIYKKYNSQIAIVVEIVPLNQNDMLYTNNTVISTFYVKGSIIQFNTEVFSDGIKLAGNDFVNSKPEFLIKLEGENISDILSDTSVFRIKLNNDFISYNPTAKTLSYNLTRSIEKNGAEYRFKPALNKGLNTLYLLTNKTGLTDTSKFVLNVTDETNILDVYNFPNPMKNYTTFTFNITNSTLGQNGSIKIFSAAGRQIKVLDFQPVTGYNAVNWNGLDSDGDYIANGVYFYRVHLNGIEEKSTDVKKLVVLK